MARGSSSKKVARAARAGGGRVRGAGQRSFLFPGLITLICVLGVALIAYARDDRRGTEQIPPISGIDHWHAAFGVYTCDDFEPAMPEFETPLGIHTHGDGVIHIHPFSENASGRNATLGVFLEESGVTLGDTSLEVGGQTYENGDKCGDKPGRVVVAKWDRAADEGEEPQLVTEDLEGVRFRKDGEAYTVAFVPEGEDVPRPESASQLEELGAIDTGAAPSTTLPAGSSTTESTTATSEASTTTASP